MALHQATQQIIIPQDWKHREMFFFPNFAVVCGVHLLALTAIPFFSTRMIAAWLVSHLFFSIFGVSLGYHRFLSHRSFTPTRAFGFFLALCATLCVQGGPIYWAAAHRAHHRFSEKNGDPHSASRGFFWSHFVWLFYRCPNGFSYNKNRHVVSDLTRFPELVFLDNFQIQVNLFLIFTAGLLALYFSAFDLFMGALPLRIVSVWHSTWLVNSYMHSAGAAKNRSQITLLQNRKFMSVLLGGEGYHRAHHERPAKLFPVSPLKSFDISFPILELLRYVGVVKYSKANQVRNSENSARHS